MFRISLKKMGIGKFAVIFYRDIYQDIYRDNFYLKLIKNQWLVVLTGTPLDQQSFYKSSFQD